MGKTIRQILCLVYGHVHCPQVWFGWTDIYCQRCGERTLDYGGDMPWEFCDKTPGCTLEKGHGGQCKPAKGF